MVDGTPKLENVSELASVRRSATGGTHGEGPRMTFPADTAGLPAAPPAEVLAAVEQASRSLDELARQRVSLRFGIAGDARLRVQVERSGTGVVKEIPVSHALELLEHDPTALADEV